MKLVEGSDSNGDLIGPQSRSRTSTSWRHRGIPYDQPSFSGPPKTSIKAVKVTKAGRPHNPWRSSRASKGKSWEVAVGETSGTKGWVLHGGTEAAGWGACGGCGDCLSPASIAVSRVATGPRPTGPVKSHQRCTVYGSGGSSGYMYILEANVSLMASGSSASTTWIIFLGWAKPCCSSHVWINSNIRWSLWVSMPCMSGRMVQQKNARMIGRIRIARRDPSVNHWKQSEKWLWEQKTNGDHSCNNRWIVILILPAIQQKNCDCDYTQFIQLKLYGGSVLPILLEKEHHHVHNLDFELLSKKGQVELSISLSCAQPHKGRLLLKNDVLRDQNKSPQTTK